MLVTRILPQVLLGIVLACGLFLWLAKIPIQYNLRNLLVRWRTTILTMLAFTMVIALLTIMLAFVNGMYRLTESSGVPENVILLSEGSTDESFSNLGFADVGDIETQPGIVRQGDQPLCSKETILVISQPLPKPQPGRPKKRFLQLRGVVDPAISGAVHNLKPYPDGDWFSPAGVRELPEGRAAGGLPAIEIVVGEGIARELARDRIAAEGGAMDPDSTLKVGDTFDLAGRTWYVTGLLQSAGSTFDSEVWGKQSLVAPMFGKETYSSVVLRTPSAANANEVRDYFRNQYTKASLAAFTESEYFSSLNATNRQFLVGIIIVGIIMAIGGLFGIMNTMFAAISQRSKDIGVLRLLGFDSWRLAVSFVMEALLLAAIGGALGCAIGSLTNGWTATSVVGSGQGGGKSVVLRMTVDSAILSTGMLVSLLMGFFGGLIPFLLSATRLKPLEALR